MHFVCFYYAFTRWASISGGHPPRLRTKPSNDMPSTLTRCPVRENLVHRRLSRRGWYREYFSDHPGYADRNPEAFVNGGDKVKVWCRRCLRQRLSDVIEYEKEQVSLGLLPAERDRRAILAQRESSILRYTMRNPHD